MKSWENPIDFEIKKKIGNKIVSYSNLMEVCQGGPVTGNISVDKDSVPTYRFGGPFLIDKGYIIAPVFIREFLNTGFKLSRINLETLEIEILGKREELIFLERVEGNRVYFYKDLNKAKLQLFDINGIL
jgi:hypothetical protein